MGYFESYRSYAYRGTRNVYRCMTKMGVAIVKSLRQMVEGEVLIQIMNLQDNDFVEKTRNWVLLIHALKMMNST